jgi:hypothetical protein
MEIFVLIAWYSIPGSMNAGGTSTRGEYESEIACVEAGESLKLEKELWNYVCLPKNILEDQNRIQGPMD